MEKKTIIPGLVEIECPPEKKRIRIGKYITLHNKRLVNKVTGVTSCDYASCKWDKCSEESKTIVLKKQSYQRGNKEVSPHVLWNYETGEIFKMNYEFADISVESDKGNYRSFRSVYGSVITFDVVTGNEIPCKLIYYSVYKSERAYAMVEDNGALVWKIEYKDGDSTSTFTYHDVEKVDINGKELWMVKYSENGEWKLLYNKKVIGTSKTGKFVKKGSCIFCHIGGDKYKMYSLTKEVEFKTEFELTRDSFIRDGKEYPFSGIRKYHEQIIGFTSDGKWFKNAKKKGFLVVSPENECEAPEKIEMLMNDDEFVGRRSYRDWAHRYFPIGSVHCLLVMDVIKSGESYFTILQDQDSNAKIILETRESFQEKDDEIFVRITKRVLVHKVLTPMKSPNYSNIAFSVPGFFEKVEEEEYVEFKNETPAARDARTSKEVSEPKTQVVSEPKTQVVAEPSLAERLSAIIPNLETYAQILLSDIGDEVSLRIVKDADGNVKVLSDDK